MGMCVCVYVCVSGAGAGGDRDHLVRQELEDLLCAFADLTVSDRSGMWHGDNVH